jgi:hypothetical protein
MKHDIDSYDQDDEDQDDAWLDGQVWQVQNFIIKIIFVRVVINYQKGEIESP